MVGHQLQTHARVGLSTGELPVGGGRIPTDMTPLTVMSGKQRVADPSAFLPGFSSKTLSWPLPPKTHPPYETPPKPSWRHRAPQCSRAVECCAACCFSAAAYRSPSKRARLCTGSSTSSCGVGVEEQVRPAGCFQLLSLLSVPAAVLWVHRGPKCGAAPGPQGRSHTWKARRLRARSRWRRCPLLMSMS